MRLFEKMLCVDFKDIEFELKAHQPVLWSDFLLNPRRLRGSDFLMRWSQGVWSERRIIQATDETAEFIAIPYGPSGTSPDDDVRAFELYFERLENAGLGKMKRPDLLIFRVSDREAINSAISRLGGLSELPFTLENNTDMKVLLTRAVLAVECENSLWKGKQMPDYGAELKPQKRLSGKLGLRKNAVLPTIILKEEDRAPIQKWQDESGVPVHIWHSFFDVAYGIALDELQRLIREGYILPTEQVFQAPGGATTRKLLYKCYYHYGYPLGDSVEEPKLKATYIEDKNGHILPYVRFDGGKMLLRKEALAVLREAVNVS